LAASYRKARCKGYTNTCKINTTKSIAKMKTFRQFMEQSPSMGEPTEYNKQVARQTATWKGRQIRQTHGEMQSKAGAELAAKDRRIKSIESN
jgi:hypothetical protein